MKPSPKRLFPILIAGLCWGLFASAARAQEGKPLPSLAEPDWTAFSEADAEALAEQVKLLRFLGEITPEREYQDSAEKKKLRDKLVAAYRDLKDNRAATLAAVMQELPRAEEDFYSLTLARLLLRELGDDAAPYLAWTLSHLRDPNENFNLVFDVAFSLSKLNRRDCLPGLFPVLKIKNAKYRIPRYDWKISARYCLYYVFGAYGPGVCPYLVPALSDENPYVRRNAAFLLGHFTYFPAQARLKAMLEDEDVGSAGAAEALGKMLCREAAEPIAALLQSPSKHIRYWAASALYELEDKATLPALTAAEAAESDTETEDMMEMAIDAINWDRPPYWRRGRVIPRFKLKKILDEAEKNNGLEIELRDIGEIVASARPEDLPQLERIREKAISSVSVESNRKLRIWNELIRSVRLRLHRQGRI